MFGKKKKARKLKVGEVKKGSGAKVKLDVGEFRDKTKEIEVVIGETTVAESLVKSGHVAADSDTLKSRTAKEEGWRLNGKVCTWTDVIVGNEPTLYRLPKVQAGLK